MSGWGLEDSTRKEVRTIGPNETDAGSRQRHFEAEQEAQRQRALHPKVGDAVVFCDPRNVDRMALVTAVHGTQPNPALNLVIVSGDETRQDSFGRQIERPSSACHASMQSAHGYYWRRLHEERNPYNVSQT